MKAIIVALASLLLLAAVSADAQPLQSAQPAITITRRGAPPAAPPAAPAVPASPRAGASHFTDEVHVAPVFQAIAPGRATASDVTFAPGARTAWHVHAAGQTLLVTAGVGRVQQWGGPVDAIHPGAVGHIPPNVKHWHGASPDAAMTHLAITEAIEGQTVAWLEPVSDAQYRAPARATVASDSARPSVTPRAMNEFAPKLAEITNRVLYGEVWPDSALSPHDRSLVTLSALIALNRPDQLRSHLGRARERHDARGGRGTHHAPGVLRRVAERGVGGRHRQRGEFQALTRIPIVIYYGDNIPATPSTNLGQDGWRARLAMARRWRDVVNRHGGDVTVVHLPEVGVRGNTHFPFSDLNNVTVADLMSGFLAGKRLDVWAPR